METKRPGTKRPGGPSFRAFCERVGCLRTATTAQVPDPSQLLAKGGMQVASPPTMPLLVPLRSTNFETDDIDDLKLFFAIFLSKIACQAFVACKKPVNPIPPATYPLTEKCALVMCHLLKLIQNIKQKLFAF
jgi:hypothetical protein